MCPHCLCIPQFSGGLAVFVGHLILYLVRVPGIYLVGLDLLTQVEEVTKALNEDQGFPLQDTHAQLTAEGGLPCVLVGCE